MRERASNLQCPNCGIKAAYVQGSRSYADQVRRRRACKNCTYHWTTYEITAERMQTVVGIELRLRAAAGTIALVADKVATLQPKRTTRPSRNEGIRDA